VYEQRDFQTAVIEKEVKEKTYYYQGEILEYKNKLKIMDYALKDKKTEINLLTNQLKKTQQEMEVMQTRINSYEVICEIFLESLFDNF